MTTPDRPLGAKLMQGSLHLGIRQLAGIALSAVGLIVITRILGPTQYGTYAEAFGFHQFTLNMGQLGVEVYLVRSPWGADCGRRYDVASSFLLLVGCIGAAVEAACVPKIALWLGLDGAARLLPFLALSLPLQLLAVPPAARLDRALDFRRVAAVELSSQTIYYAVAIALAVLGWGPWALAVSWVIQQLAACMLYHAAARWLPHFAWEGAVLREMLGYALGYSSSSWLWQARSLINPVIVGGVLGSDAVGLVSLVIRVVELLAFAKGVVWRVSTAGFAFLQSQPDKMLASIANGSELQAIAVGVPLTLFAGVGAYIISAFVGSAWLPSFEIYPFIALAYLTNSVFALHSSALSVLRQNADVALFHLAHLALFAAGAYLFVRMFGLKGYGYAEVTALASYIVLHLRVRRVVGPVSYRFALPWYLCFALALLLRPFSLWFCAAALVPLGWPPTRRHLLGYLSLVRRPKSAG